jgi:hypothetical protein
MAKQEVKQEAKQEKKQAGSKGAEKLTEDGVVPAIVEAVLGRAGTRGEITQVKCKILQGKNDDEIKAELVAEFGDAILLSAAPQNNLLIWILPLFLRL